MRKLIVAGAVLTDALVVMWGATWWAALLNLVVWQVAYLKCERLLERSIADNEVLMSELRHPTNNLLSHSLGYLEALWDKEEGRSDGR